MTGETVSTALLLAAFSVAAAPSIGTVQIAPTSIAAGTPTTVRVTATITDPTLIASTVNLQRLNDAGAAVAVLGSLHDDGLNGDAVAGDQVYTLEAMFTETAPQRLRVSAGFRGMLRRVFSAELVLNISRAPAVSLTTPIDGAVYTLPVSVTLTATASGIDGATQISRVDFYQGTTLIGGGTAAPYTTTWTPAAPGSYTFTARATDSAGGVATSAARSITVQAANAAPSVRLTSPAANQSFTAPASITLSASASDVDGSLARVDFFQGTTLIGSATVAPYSVVWNDVPVGSYRLTARATDNLGATTTSTAVPITVTAAGTTILYLHTDHLGTPRVATNESNVVVWRNLPTTEPFGMALPEEDPDGDGRPTTINLRFPGQYFDRETQLHYNYFRDYDPGVGRYVQSDPLGLGGGINTYGYVRGNPTSTIDPFGLYTYMCTKPLHGLGPVWGQRFYPASKWNPLPTYHQFLCFNDGEHEPECGGMDRSGSAAWSDGKPSVDSYPKNQPEDGQCKQVDDRKCVDHCVLRNIRDPKRPGYGIGPQRYPGDCQEWADFVLEKCKQECRGKD